MVRDPVHDYVEVPGELAALVGSPAVQRLRGISQNALARVRYPALTGSRYEHALGTMHLAMLAWHGAWARCDEVLRGRFARQVVADLRGEMQAGRPVDAATARWLAPRQGDDDDPAAWPDFARVVGLAVGAIGLLHDVGHPPFSHKLEEFWGSIADNLDDGGSAVRRPAQQFHEWAGERIVTSLPDSCFPHLPRLLVERVLSARTGDDWAHCLHSIVDGQFDVDRLDYLMRDGLGAGTELGRIDWRRLVDSLELHQVPHGWRIGLGARAISAFETMLMQRAQHYRWVVHHQAAVAADACLARCVEGVHDLATAELAESSSAATAALLELRHATPDLDYLTAAVCGDLTAGVCRDDAACLTWLRTARSPLLRLAEVGTPDVRARARLLVRLHDVCDGLTVEPVPAWRNYQEFLARAEQNQDAVATLVSSALAPRTPDYLSSDATREAVRMLLGDLPARLNSALDHRLAGPAGREVERRLTAQVPWIEGCGEGFWLIEPVSFLAVREEFATVWRGDDEALLSAVSPFPFALTAIEVMRPRYFAYFVPYGPVPDESEKHARRAIGRAFFEALAGHPT